MYEFIILEKHNMKVMDNRAAQTITVVDIHLYFKQMGYVTEVINKVMLTI